MTTNVFVAILLLRPAVRSVKVMNEYRLTYSLDSQCSFVNSAIKTLPSASFLHFVLNIFLMHLQLLSQIDEWSRNCCHMMKYTAVELINE